MKLNKIAMVVTITIPLALFSATASSTNASAAKINNAKYQNYALASVREIKAGTYFKAKTNQITAYKATFMADEPVASFGGAQTVKLSSRKLPANQKVVVKISKESVNSLLKSKRKYKAAKNATFYHIKKVGWVKASSLSK
ncbi:hypothetical protein MOO44_00540 (plasmid) [Nicoliella spurrieriana]|uniref:Surface layer protein A domain-containing protein n=1 Tax=Nicoliella spurrieriana TaxID=2925830 RepID=A0A976RQV7_9LACO|nr:hypothetical protein [Nicoliella spurrieriana]UQS86164.1 hypothetical protein MOO44_00540 [Nicoliella spurrieriana]